jgi:hypothetical protein
MSSEPTKKERKSKPGSGKGKGGGFEREVAAKLSLWFSEGVRDDIFYRSHSSGGRFTMRGKSHKDTAYQSGDITCSDPIGQCLMDQWSIECKTGYGKWDVLDLIDSNQQKPQIKQFFEQCSCDALKCGKQPILIFRRPLRKICICIYKEYFLELGNCFGFYTGQIIYIEPDNLAVVNFSDFLLWVYPGHFK